MQRPEQYDRENLEGDARVGSSSFLTTVSIDSDETRQDSLVAAHQKKKLPAKVFSRLVLLKSSTLVLNLLIGEKVCAALPFVFVSDGVFLKDLLSTQRSGRKMEGEDKRERDEDQAEKDMASTTEEQERDDVTGLQREQIPQGMNTGERGRKSRDEGMLGVGFPSEAEPGRPQDRESASREREEHVPHDLFACDRPFSLSKGVPARATQEAKQHTFLHLCSPLFSESAGTRSVNPDDNEGSQSDTEGGEGAGAQDGRIRVSGVRRAKEALESQRSIEGPSFQQDDPTESHELEREINEDAFHPSGRTSLSSLPSLGRSHIPLVESQWFSGRPLHFQTQNDLRLFPVSPPLSFSSPGLKRKERGKSGLTLPVREPEEGEKQLDIVASFARLIKVIGRRTSTRLSRTDQGEPASVGEGGRIGLRWGTPGSIGTESSSEEGNSTWREEVGEEPNERRVGESLKNLSELNLDPSLSDMRWEENRRERSLEAPKLSKEASHGANPEEQERQETRAQGESRDGASATLQRTRRRTGIEGTMPYRGNEVTTHTLESVQEQGDRDVSSFTFQKETPFFTLFCQELNACGRVRGGTGKGEPVENVMSECRRNTRSSSLPACSSSSSSRIFSDSPLARFRLETRHPGGITSRSSQLPALLSSFPPRIVTQSFRFRRRYSHGNVPEDIISAPSPASASSPPCSFASPFRCRKHSRGSLCSTCPIPSSSSVSRCTDSPRRTGGSESDPCRLSPAASSLALLSPSSSSSPRIVLHVEALSESYKEPEGGLSSAASSFHSASPESTCAVSRKRLRRTERRGESIRRSSGNTGRVSPQLSRPSPACRRIRRRSGDALGEHRTEAEPRQPPRGRKGERERTDKSARGSTDKEEAKRGEHATRPLFERPLRLSSLAVDKVSAVGESDREVENYQKTTSASEVAGQISGFKEKDIYVLSGHSGEENHAASSPSSHSHTPVSTPEVPATAGGSECFHNGRTRVLSLCRETGANSQKPFTLIPAPKEGNWKEAKERIEEISTVNVREAVQKYERVGPHVSLSKEELEGVGTERENIGGCTVLVKKPSVSTPDEGLFPFPCSNRPQERNKIEDGERDQGKPEREEHGESSWKQPGSETDEHLVRKECVSKDSPENRLPLFALYLRQPIAELPYVGKEGTGDETRTEGCRRGEATQREASHRGQGIDMGKERRGSYGDGNQAGTAQPGKEPVEEVNAQEGQRSRQAERYPPTGGDGEDNQSCSKLLPPGGAPCKVQRENTVLCGLTPLSSLLVQKSAIEMCDDAEGREVLAPEKTHTRDRQRETPNSVPINRVDGGAELAQANEAGGKREGERRRAATQPEDSKKAENEGEEAGMQDHSGKEDETDTNTSYESLQEKPDGVEDNCPSNCRKESDPSCLSDSQVQCLAETFWGFCRASASSSLPSSVSSSSPSEHSGSVSPLFASRVTSLSSSVSSVSSPAPFSPSVATHSSSPSPSASPRSLCSSLLFDGDVESGTEEQRTSPASPSSLGSPRVSTGRSTGDLSGSLSRRFCFLRSSLLPRRARANGPGDKKKRITVRKAAATPVRPQSRQDQITVSNTHADSGATKLGSHLSRKEEDVPGPGENPFEVGMDCGRSVRDQGRFSACALSQSSSSPRVTPFSLSLSPSLTDTSSLPLPRCERTGLSSCSHRSSRDGVAVSLEPPLFVRVAATATSMDMSAYPESSMSETKAGNDGEMKEAKDAPHIFREQSDGDGRNANQDAQVSRECLGSRGVGEMERQMWTAGLGRPDRAEERAEDVEKPGEHGQSEERRNRGRRRPERSCALKKESQYQEADAHTTSTPSGTPASRHVAVGECHHAFSASSSSASSPAPASALSVLSSCELPAVAGVLWSPASPRGRGVPLALDSDEEPAGEGAGTEVCACYRFSEEEEENEVEHYHENEGRKEQRGQEVLRKGQNPGESEGGEETTKGGAAREGTKRTVEQAEQEDREDDLSPGKYGREQDETSSYKGKMVAAGEAERNEDDREASHTEDERGRHDPNILRTRRTRECEEDALRPVTPSSFPPQFAGRPASSRAASRQSVSAPCQRDPDPQVVVELSDEEGDTFGDAASSDASRFFLVVPRAEVEETSESCLTTNIGLVYSCSEEREETGHAFPLSVPPVLVTDDERVSEREVLVESAWVATERQRHEGACLLPNTKGGREAAGGEGPQLEDAAVLLTDDDSEAEEANSSGELWRPPRLLLEDKVEEIEQEAIKSPSDSGSELVCRFVVAEKRSEGDVGDRADSWPAREVDEQIHSMRTGQRQGRGASTATEISCLARPCECVARKSGERSEDDTATVSPAHNRFVMHPAVAAPPHDYSSSSPSSFDKDQLCPRRMRGEWTKAHGGGETEATGDIEERVARNKGSKTDGGNPDREPRREKTGLGHRGRVSVDNAAAAVPPHSVKRPGGRTAGKTRQEDRHGKGKRKQARGADLRQTEGAALDHERRPKEHRGQARGHLSRRERQTDTPGKLCWRVDDSRRSDGREGRLTWGTEAEISDGSPDAQMKRDPNGEQLKDGTREALYACSISDEEAQSHDFDEDANGEALAFQAASAGAPTTTDIVAGCFHSDPSRVGTFHARSFAPSSPASPFSSAQVSCSVASVARRRHSLALPLSSGGPGSVTQASEEAEVFWRRMSTGEVGAREKRSHSSSRGKREEAPFPSRIGRRPPLPSPSGASFRVSLSRIGEDEEGETQGREEAQMLMHSSVLPLKEEAGFPTAGKSRVASHSMHRGASVPKDDGSTTRPVEATSEGDEDWVLSAGVKGERKAPGKPRQHAGNDEHERGSGDERHRRQKPGEARRSPVSRAARVQKQSTEASAKLYTGGNVSEEDTRKEDTRPSDGSEERRSPTQSESREVLPLPSAPRIQRRGETDVARTRIVDKKQQEVLHAKGDLPTGKAAHVQRLRSVLIIERQTDDEDEQKSGEHRAERDPDRSSLRRLLQGSRLRIETDEESSEDERLAPSGGSVRMPSSQSRFSSGSSASSQSSFSSPSFSDTSSGSRRETVSRPPQKRRNKTKKKRHCDIPRSVPADAYSDGSVAEDMRMLRFERRTSEKKTPGRSADREATVEKTERGKSAEARARDEKLWRRGTRVFMEVVTDTEDEWGEETTEMTTTGWKKFSEDSRVLSSLPGNDISEEVDKTRQISAESGATAKGGARSPREKLEEPRVAREAAYPEQLTAKVPENQADKVTARSDDRVARLPRESSHIAHSHEKLTGTLHDQKWRSPRSEKGSKRTGDASCAHTPLGGTHRGSGGNRQDSKRNQPLHTQKDGEEGEGDGGEANEDRGCSGDILARSKPNTMWRATHWWRAALESFFSMSLLSSYELVGTKGAAGVLRGELPGPNSVSLLSSNWHDRLQWSFRQVVEEARRLGIVAREKWADKELLLCKEIGYFTAAARAAAVVLSHTHPAGDFDAASNQEFLTAEGDGVWLRRGRGADDTDRKGASLIRKGKMSQAKPGVAGCFVEVKPDNLPAVWRVYRPKFEDDKVFVFDSLVLTVVHGSRRHGVSTRSARKVYANDYKGRQAAASVIYQMNLTADLACDAEAEEFLMSDVHRRHLQFARKTQDLDFGRTDYALPVCTLVDYAGQRIMVEPLMPIEPEPVNVEKELVEILKKEMPFYVQQCKARGSEYLALDAVDKVDRKVDRKMRFISKSLNIFGCPFPFGHSDFDSKCRIPRAHLWRSRVDQLCVLRNLQELLPPAVIKGKVHPTHRMRERFVQQIFDIPLPSTAAAPWTATKAENTISKFLQTTRPGSGLELLEVAHDALVECVQDDLVPTIEALHVNFLDSSDVSHALHEQGVNMKSLGLMYNRFAGAVFRDASLREMLARAAKHLFLKQMEVLVRKKAYRKVLWVELLQTTIVALFNIVLGTTEETRSFWQEQLLPEVAEMYVS
ncbi:translation initiation factor eIF3 subunit 135, partial [Toxoplasma gondii VAND]